MVPLPSSARPVLAFALALVLSACSSSPRGGRDGGGADGAPARDGSAGRDASDRDGGGGSADAAGGTSYPMCRIGCTVDADCGTTTAAFDADNYTCDDGVCRYSGCNDDAECASTYMDDRYGCRSAEPADRGLPVPTGTHNCVLTCDSSDDCSTASAAFDADNYECVDSVCRYRGCNDDAECAASFMDDRYVCR